MPGLIDRYISRLYLRVAGLSFLSLLGLFYISTFIDRSDKMFKGQASAAMIGQLLVWLTPQFIYYVIPDRRAAERAGDLRRCCRATSELTVMKACGISLYRTALSVVLSVARLQRVLFALEQRVMATANREAEALDAQIRGRQPKTLNMLNRRWVVGADNVIYHYGFFDPQRNELFGLTMFTALPNTWAARDADVRAAGGLSRHNMGRRTGMDAGLHEQSAHLDTDREKSAARTRAARVLRQGAARRPVHDGRASCAATSRSSQPAASTSRRRQVELQRKLAFPFVTLVMTLLAVPVRRRRRPARRALRHRARRS